MRYAILILTFLVAMPNADAKKHLLQYHFIENTSNEYLRTDSVKSVMLIGGLGERMETFMQCAYSVRFVSETEQGDANLLLKFNRIEISTSFNGQETLRIHTTQARSEKRNEAMLSALTKLISVSFPFSIQTNGEATSLPNFDDYIDSLQLSKAEKRSLVVFFHQDYLHQVIKQSFPVLPKEKIKEQSSWQATSLGTLNLPYRLELKHHLLITDKTSFSIKSKGLTNSDQPSVIRLGRASIGLTLNASEAHQRICSMEDGGTKTFKYVANATAYPTGSQAPATNNTAPISYRVKTILVKK